MFVFADGGLSRVVFFCPCIAPYAYRLLLRIAAICLTKNELELIMMKKGSIILSFHAYGLILPVMKKLLIILFLCVSAVSVYAQEDRRHIAVTDTIGGSDMMPQNEIIGSADGPTHVYLQDGDFGVGMPQTDSLHLPAFDSLGRMYVNMYPLDWCGAYNWDLHKGLNVNLGASVFASFGKGAWRGSGFGQNIAAMYAIPVNNKLSIAVGGYLNHLYWTSDSYMDAGLNAVIGYKFDEHWEGYIYGQKSLSNKRMPYPLYDIGNIGDRIGAAVKYNFSPSFSIQVAVEGRTMK